MSIRLPLLTTIISGALVLGACGGAETAKKPTITTKAPTTTTSKAATEAEWLAAVDVRCGAFLDAVDMVDEDAGLAMQAATVAELLDGYATDVRKTPAPTSMRADITEYTKIITDGAESLRNSYGEDELIAAVEELGSAADTKAEELGLSCRFRDDTDTTTETGDDVAWGAAAEDVCSTVDAKSGEIFAAFGKEPLANADKLANYLSEVTSALYDIDVAPGEAGITLLAQMETLTAAGRSLADNTNNSAAEISAAADTLTKALDAVNTAAAAVAPACGGF